MKQYFYHIACIATVLMLTAGCGTEKKTELQQDIGQKETALETELEEFFLPAEEALEETSLIVEYAEETEYPALAAFLADYYQIPEEYQTETRYYYNRVDLNEDGKDEIFAVVIGEYTEGEAGNPALLLSVEEDAFTVLENFEQILTPVTISDELTNGWHDIVFWECGKGVDTGYLTCHYNLEGGYQTDLNEFSTDEQQVEGIQILSNNLIDDMDQGKYFTLRK